MIMDTVNVDQTGSVARLKGRLGGKLQAQQSRPVDERKMPSMKETELSVSTSGFVALNNNALELISKNLKHQQLTHSLFDVIKAPSGGSTVFLVPGLAGDEAQKELSGIILDYNTPRAYWDTPDPVEGTPPVCQSRDSIISDDGKPCVRCQYNTFGSKDGESNAKACKESVELFLLRQDNVMPVIVRIPVSSKLLFQKYMTRLIGRIIPLSGVVTKITLERATSKTGQPYALYNFEAVSMLSSQEAASARNFAQKFMEILNAGDQPEMPEAV